MSGTIATSELIRVDCVADHYRRYAGEPVQLFVRVTLYAAVEQLRLAIELPARFVLENTTAPSAWPNLAAEVLGVNLARASGNSLDDADNAEMMFSLTWNVQQHIPAGVYEFEVLGRVTVPERTPDDLEQELRFVAEAMIMYAGWAYWSREGVSVALTSRARYLKYLPSLYRNDETMGRLLMLFESFLKPIERQIDTLDDTFDPRLTPAALLPWLATWVDLRLDAAWSEDKQRRLLRSCVALYRQRGTHAGLSAFLEIYTGVVPKIIEHRASNLRLGRSAALGQGIAIGRNNVPHGLTIQLRLPTLPEAEAELRRKVIASIVEAEKPAHSTYRLEIEEIASAT